MFEAWYAEWNREPGSAPRLAPPQSRRDLLQDAFDDVGAVFDAKLVWNRQKEGVRLGDGLVGAKFPDQFVGRAVAAAEDGARVLVEEAHLIPLVAAAAK